MARILYISYDGLAEPLGQSQVIPYLKKLSDENEIHVISFEKPFDLKVLRTDVDKYIESDEELIKLKQKKKNLAPYFEHRALDQRI